MTENFTLPIVFAALGDGYNDYPGRQDLLKAFATHTSVFLLKWQRPRKEFFSAPKIRQVKQNVFEVENAFLLRTSRLKVLRKSLAIIDTLLLKKALGNLNIRKFVYWVSTPDERLFWARPSDLMVYDSVDPCFIPKEQEKHDKAEFQFAKTANVVFCTAKALQERLQGLNKNCFLLPNACNIDTYNFCKKPELIVPGPLANVPRPIIGYMGTMDWRFDVKVMEYAVCSLPEFTFVFVGRLNQDQDYRFARLRSFRNAVFTGSVSYQDGLAYTAAFDVGVIPFIPGELNDAINPVKMYMYLAAGKPVVTTDLRETRFYNDFVRVSSTNDDFVAALKVSVRENNCDLLDKRMSFAKENCWEKRANQATSILNTIFRKELVIGKSK